jgi:orotate phosphoribosyltransferase
MENYQREFISLALRNGALRFGEFRLKSGRLSPYFFNLGSFCTGASLNRLGEFYAATITRSAPDFQMLFGPAYKGIPLVTASAMALARQHGRDFPWCFDRKEAKAHGEGGMLVGAPLRGRVLIIDDVLTAGTAVGHAVDLIRAQGAEPAGLVISLDRMERGRDSLSASQEVARQQGMPVLSIVDLDVLISFLSETGEHRDQLGRIRSYRAEYGV